MRDPARNCSEQERLCGATERAELLVRVGKGEASLTGEALGKLK